MSKHPISRRHIIKLGSLTAASVVASPFKIAAHELQGKEWGNGSKVQDAAGEICFMSAVEMAALLRAKKISSREVMQAHLKQIANINGKVNAIVTLVPEEDLMAQALAAD